MKKLITALFVVSTPVALHAQNSLRMADGRYFSQEFVTIPATLIAVYLVSSFILSVIRWSYDHRLKSKLAEKGVSDKVVEQFLQPRNKDVRAQALKWSLILAGIGMGLMIVYYTTPLGIHSFGIMAFSIALSFLGYFYYLKQTGNHAQKDQ